MTKASDTGLRQNRVVMMMSDAELKAVDDWRFMCRIGSRGDAIRQLSAIGILWWNDVGQRLAATLHDKHCEDPSQAS